MKSNAKKIQPLHDVCVCLWFQGIVPAKAAKMAHKSVTLMTEKLINIKVSSLHGSYVHHRTLLTSAGRFGDGRPCVEFFIDSKAHGRWRHVVMVQFELCAA